MKRALALSFALCAAGFLSFMSLAAIPWILGAGITGWLIAPRHGPVSDQRLARTTPLVGMGAAVPLALSCLASRAGIWPALGVILFGLVLGLCAVFPLAPIVFAAGLAPGGEVAQGAAIRRTYATAAFMAWMSTPMLLVADWPFGCIASWLWMLAGVVAAVAAADARALARLRTVRPQLASLPSYRESALPIPSVREDPFHARDILARQLVFDVVVLALCVVPVPFFL
jgi:hypothetical protein